MRGIVRWFDARRGYGFIVPDEGGPDVFLHRRVLQSSAGVRRLEPGQIVEYGYCFLGEVGKGIKPV